MLTIRPWASFSQNMKMSKVQIEKMVRMVFDELTEKKLIEAYKVPMDKAHRRAVELIEEEFAVEAALDREVHKMLDDLEQQNPDGFQRGKMFSMLKRKLAEQKGLVL